MLEQWSLSADTHKEKCTEQVDSPQLQCSVGSPVTAKLLPQGDPWAKNQVHDRKIGDRDWWLSPIWSLPLYSIRAPNIKMNS